MIAHLLHTPFNVKLPLVSILIRSTDRKTLEQTLDRIIGNAGPLVLDGHAAMILLRDDIDFDQAIFRRKIDRVVQQVLQRLRQQERIARASLGGGIDDEDEEVGEVVRGEHDPIDRLLQIQLELRLRSPQSSRELARSLKTTKYEINNILYHQPELFEKEGTSPPMWSNKGEIQ